AILAGMRASSWRSGWLVKRGVGAGVGLGRGLGVAVAEAIPERCDALGEGVPGPGSAVEQAEMPAATSTRQDASARSDGRAAAGTCISMGGERIAARSHSTDG